MSQRKKKSRPKHTGRPGYGKAFWLEVRTAYEEEKFTSVTKLAASFGVNRRSIALKIKDQGWKTKSEVANEARDRAAQKAAASVEKHTLNEIERANKNHKVLYGGVQRAAGNMLQIIIKATEEALAEVQEGKSTGMKECGKLSKMVYQLQALTGTIHQSAQGNRQELNMDSIPLDTDTTDWDKYQADMAQMRDAANNGSFQEAFKKFQE